MKAWIVYAHFQDEGFDYYLTAHTLADDEAMAAEQALRKTARLGEPLDVRVIELDAMPKANVQPMLLTVEDVARKVAAL